MNEAEKQLEICLGDSGIPPRHAVASHARPAGIFGHPMRESWLSHPRRFAIAPGLPLIPDRQLFARRRDSIKRPACRRHWQLRSPILGDRNCCGVRIRRTRTPLSGRRR